MTEKMNILKLTPKKFLEKLQIEWVGDEVDKKFSSYIKAGGCAVSYQKTVSKNL
jgi:hypothetical protein